MIGIFTIAMIVIVMVYFIRKGKEADKNLIHPMEKEGVYDEHPELLEVHGGISSLTSSEDIYHPFSIYSTLRDD